jgi:hypothetical protein
MSHNMKLWKRVIEHRLRGIIKIFGNQFDFMPNITTMETIFVIKQVIEQYREQRKDLHIIFIDLGRHMTKYE